MSLPTNFQRFDTIGSDEPVRHAATPIRKPRPVCRTAAQLLKTNHGRRPLRCDHGPVRKNFAVLQTDTVRLGPKI